MKKKKAQLEKKKKELELLEKELQEEKERIETEAKDLTDKINDLVKDKYFCGVILTKEDIFSILNLYIDTKENIKIKFNLYNEEE